MLTNCNLNRNNTELLISCNNLIIFKILAAAKVISTAGNIATNDSVQTEAWFEMIADCVLWSCRGTHLRAVARAQDGVSITRRIVRPEARVVVRVNSVGGTATVGSCNVPLWRLCYAPVSIWWNCKAREQRKQDEMNDIFGGRLGLSGHVRPHEVDIYNGGRDAETSGRATWAFLHTLGASVP